MLRYIRKRLTTKMTRAPIESFISARASRGHTLEIGSASSYYAHYFPDRVGFDIRPGPAVDVVGDVHALPFEDSSFDIVLCVEVLEHLHTPQKALDEMRRVLRPGGTLLLTTRFAQTIHDAPGDYYRFTRYGLAHMLREWDAVEIYEDMSSARAFGALLQRFAFQCDVRGGVFTKTLLLMLAHTTALLHWLIIREYGRKNTLGTHPERAIFPAGYHVCART